MIRAVVRGFKSISVPDVKIEGYVPDNPVYFAIQVTVGISPEDGELEQ